MEYNHKSMKTKKLKMMLLAIAFLAASHGLAQKLPNWAGKAIKTSETQLLAMAHKLDGTSRFPRNTVTSYPLAFISRQLERSEAQVSQELPEIRKDAGKLGSLATCDIYDWVSGFFPGSLWYGYQLTKDPRLKTEAAKYTNELEPISHFPSSHDIGFMINCSYGNALRLAPNDTIKDVIVAAANTLCRRFDKKIGCIRSWDFGPWNFPVIIDNMMNLDLLFNAWHLTGDTRYRDIAVAHAETTMRHHFRPDYTCYHVVSYKDDGTVEWRGTHQGQSDSSAWARGQAWAVYGYTRCYIETKKPEFLKQAVNVADMIMRRVTTDDAIPYWDYDAPASADTPRDASAAAVTASALFDLGKVAKDGSKYTAYATRIMKSLCSPAYLARPGENNGFILMHSVGSLPHGSQIDTPLAYADYYFLEALTKM